MDPNTATREQFTRQLLDAAIQNDAATEWKDQANNLRDVLSKLAYHEAMSSNLQQTYITPSNSKNKIYFMWDFIGRTLGMLYNVDPRLPLRTSAEKKAWSDVVGRSTMGAGLLLDDHPGMLDMMVDGTYSNQSGPRPVVGEEVIQAARKLKTES